MFVGAFIRRSPKAIGRLAHRADQGRKLPVRMLGGLLAAGSLSLADALLMVFLNPIHHWKTRWFPDVTRSFSVMFAKHDPIGSLTGLAQRLQHHARSAMHATLACHANRSS
ncbi:MAG: hypothetical protein R6U98_36890, partial [Pirellulaceae bacterium]